MESHNQVSQHFPLLLKDDPKLITVHLYTMDPSFQEGTSNVFSYVSHQFYYLTTVKHFFFSFPRSIMRGKMYFLIRQKNTIILSGHPYLCFCKASQSEDGSNRLKQHVIRRHHTLFSTFLLLAGTL